MKKLPGLMLALSVFALPAWSGDCSTGSDCANCCPLAKVANERLATGTEALTVSSIVRKDFVGGLLRDIEGI
ncbi:MAG: hypothetical protein AAGD14_18905 [Planctomycetota bacterium]